MRVLRTEFREKTVPHETGLAQHSMGSTWNIPMFMTNKVHDCWSRTGRSNEAIEGQSDPKSATGKRGSLSSSSQDDLALELLCSHQEEASQRVGHLYRLTPVPARNFLNLFKVPSADPKNNLFRCYPFRVGPL